MPIDPSPQMWATLAVTALAVTLFVTEWVAVEMAALAVLSVLLVLFELFPVPGLEAGALLAGFGNPALIAVLALLVVGEGLVNTGALDRVARVVGGVRMTPEVALAVALAAVAALSAVLNNTPVVVIFVPIFQALAKRLDIPASRVMMPLSFAAILGGMTTLIGSSTNLLVSSALITLGLEPLGFFEFTSLGVCLAALGLVYLLAVGSRILPDRADMAAAFGGSGRQFVSQCVVPADSSLVGETAVAGFFRGLPGITVQMIHRGREVVLPPYEGFAIRAGDMLMLAAPRPALAEAAVRHPGLLHPPSRDGVDDGRSRVVAAERAAGEASDSEMAEMVLAEVMVPPSSRLVGFNILQVGFRRSYGCVVLGIQRRARMMRGRMDLIRLEGGDVLLVQGPAGAVRGLQKDRDLVVISGSRGVMPKPHHARIATGIFAVVVGVAALGLMPIAVAAFAGASLMVASGALNVRQAVRALDRRVALLVASALALGEALQATGGATWLAHAILGALPDFGPAGVLSAFFLLVALATNLLSNNACAVLFTPIAVSLAGEVGADPHAFAIATLFAANCSFASPIGYQTNLLVMGPGHYRFADFARAGLPLLLLVWVAFSLLAPMWWDL